MPAPPPNEWFSLLDSWSRELLSATDRIQYLIAEHHQPSKGTYREALLRRLLRRVLPGRFRVSTGFIYRWDAPPSGQIDVLIWDAQEHSALLEEGEFAILTADAVAAIVEVKSTLNWSELRKSLRLLNPPWWINWRHTPEASLTGLPQQVPGVPFRAIFAYTDEHDDISATAKSVFSHLASFYRKQLGTDAERALTEHPGIDAGMPWVNMINVICVAEGPQIEQASLLVDSDDSSSFTQVPSFASYTGYVAGGNNPRGNVSVGRFCMNLLRSLSSWPASEPAHATLRSPAELTTPGVCYFGEFAGTPNRLRVLGEDIPPETLWTPKKPLWKGDVAGL